MSTERTLSGEAKYYAQLLKKVSAFCRTRTFITVLTRARIGPNAEPNKLNTHKTRFS
jgi:hypothetical protein